MPELENRLIASGLAMRFGHRRLFRNLSFEVVPQKPVALTGLNGSGKSTLLKILAGVLHPSEGDVRLRLRGQDIPMEGLPMRIGFVAPYMELYAPFTGRENLRFLATARRLENAAHRITDVLRQVGLGDRGDDFVSTYSTGMRQRLRIASALLHEPHVLLMDEPSATLDDAGRELAMHLIRSPGRIVVVATNDLEEASLCAERIHLRAEP